MAIIYSSISFSSQLRSTLSSRAVPALIFHSARRLVYT